MLVYFITEVSSHGTWPLLEEIQDPELKGLADKLPETVLKSRADSTTKKYLGAFRRWKQWALKHGAKSFPVDGKYLALYLQYIGETSGSKSAVEEAVHAIAWIHSAAGVNSPTSSPFITIILEGLHRSLARPVTKKAPVNIEMLAAMVDDTRKNETLSNVRLSTVCLLAFAGFLRFDEISKLCPIDLTIDEDKLIIKIRSSKTDQWRKGNEVVISRMGSATCPVGMLERYLSLGKINLDDRRYLFRGITKTKNGESLRVSGSLTYSRLRELLRTKLAQLGYDPDKFGIHSLRAGGATRAANAGIPDRLFKRHGRWKSETAKDGYIEDSMENRLQVSNQLGL